jgi:DHA2 family multidrug resistance protein-like MFS transporter
MAPVVTNLPAEAAAVAGDSVGGAAAVATQIGAAGVPLLEAAGAAFIDGMGIAVWVAAGVALLGAVVTGVFLPARPLESAGAGSLRVDDAR